jgi:hypothetical protein
MLVQMNWDHEPRQCHMNIDDHPAASERWSRLRLQQQENLATKNVRL